jgi:hypothetical protein
MKASHSGGKGRGMYSASNLWAATMFFKFSSILSEHNSPSMSSSPPFFAESSETLELAFKISGLSKAMKIVERANFWFQIIARLNHGHY